jgi:DNA-binding NarL/FixJ family response regulator
LPGVLILALTVCDSDEQVFRALCAGALGCLLKNTARACSARPCVALPFRRPRRLAGS